MINFDIKLIAVGLSILTSIIISFVVLLNNKYSDTNKIFFAFTFSTIFWGVINYLNSQISFPNEQLALLFLRLNLFFGLWQSFFIFHFFLIFPQNKIEKKWWMLFIIFPLVILTSILIFTPYIFSKVLSFSGGHIINVATGPFIALFGVLATGFVISGIIIMFKKYLRYIGTERIQARLILNGSFLMFLLIIIFNFVLPIFFNNSDYVSIAAVFAIPFIILTGYSIIKYHLFNVKIIATELITFILWIFILTRTLIADSSQEKIVNGILFVIVVIFGLSLIKSVRQEVKQRERLEILTKELEVANEKLKGLDKLKTEFVSLASHQLRSPLTAIKGYTSMLLQGDYGEINPQAKDAVERILESSSNLTLVVEDLLNVSKIESGGMKYVMEKFDFGELIRDTVKDLSITAEKKGLKLIYNIPDDKKYFVNGDKEKLRQVLVNIIDNGMKYTKEGQIEVNLRLEIDKVILSIKDTGVGISPDIIKTLFKKFSRGDRAELNTSGSGLGLYLVREIIDAHKGRVWVESEGLGKGSTFFVELNEEK